MSNDALADLGLDELGLGDTVATPDDDAAAAVVDAAVAANEDATEKQQRVAVQIGEIEIGEAEDLAPMQRAGFSTGPRGSKYPFEKLPAPVAREDGSFGYVPFVAHLPEGEDWDRFRRSVQSAATAQNRKAKEAGTVEYYVTRSVTDKEGKNVALKVYRVDNTLAE